MTTPDYPRRSTTYGVDTDVTAYPTSDTSTGAQSVSDAGRQVAGTAQDEAKNVAATAGEQVSNVASEARDQTRHLVSQTMDEARSQTNDQMSRIGGKVREVASEMQQMASQSDQHGTASHLVGDLASRGSRIADWLEDHGPEDVMTSVRRYARRSPVGFLAAAAGAGLVVGRLARAMQASSPNSGAGSRRPLSETARGYTTYGGTTTGGAVYGSGSSSLADTYPPSGGTVPSPYAPETTTTDPYGNARPGPTTPLAGETDLPREGW